jgi:hypothetical protein
MAKFRKKPVVVDAEQFNPNAIRGSDGWPLDIATDSRSHTGYSMRTLENVAQCHEVTPGDWIITGTAGERYPCKDHIFREIYEPV